MRSNAGMANRHKDTKKSPPSALWLGLVPVILPIFTVYEDGNDSVPKRRHIKFRRWGITQKKEYNIQNTEKV